MNTKVLVAGSSLLGLAAGGVGGYFLAKKHFDEKYRKQYEDVADAEIKMAREYYKTLYKGDEYSSPEKVAYEKRVPSRPVGVDDSEHEGPPTEVLERVLNGLKKQNGYGMVPEPSSARGADAMGPYQISEDTFSYDEDEGYVQGSLIWFAGDDTVADMQDEVIHRHEELLGRITLDMFDGEQTIYIRNIQHRTDYEINLNEHGYAQFVLDLPITNES